MKKHRLRLKMGGKMWTMSDGRYAIYPDKLRQLFHIPKTTQEIEVVVTSSCPYSYRAHIAPFSDEHWYNIVMKIGWPNEQGEFVPMLWAIGIYGWDPNRLVIEVLTRSFYNWLKDHTTPGKSRAWLSVNIVTPCS